ncbi:putative integral membrane protein [Clavispora lusitaniae]|uniref:putative integral membrane protein n=1 Tax=Clavispora lusitaniae TaxID=36911 RepID=UPI00202C7471|nr:putative integral membrane protein [Clavispora lusitaniae]
MKSTIVIQLPLAISRQVVYLAILASAIFLFLLPVSVVTYLNFHKMLVPTERMQTPTKLLQNTDGWKTASIDPSPAIPYLKANQDLLFSVRLNLNAVCRLEKSFQLIEYQFNFGNQTFADDVIVNCDSRYIYVEKNWWIPYHLRYWVPPLFVDIFKFVKKEIPLVDMSGSQLLSILSASNSTVQLDKYNVLLIDSKNTSIDFVVKWSGLRYYLVEFYFTSFFIGVFGFWLACSLTCVITALVFSSYLSAPKEEVVDTKMIKSEQSFSSSTVQ